MLSLGLSLTGIPVLGRRGPAYDPDALAFFARLTNQPTDARKKLYSDLIASLKTAGVWAKLDALYILAAADAQAARQNLVANTYNLTAVGSPAFAADRGYTGDGVGAYLNTNYTPSTNASALALNSASVWLWSRTNAVSNQNEVGNSAGNRITLGSRATSLRIFAGLNTGGAPSNTVDIGTGIGLFGSSRANSATQKYWFNGTQAGADFAQASTALPTVSQWILGANNTTFSNKQLSLAAWGAALTDPEVAAFYTALNTYLAAVGAA